MGRHFGGCVTSFHIWNPSSFLAAYGWGGQLIDDNTWKRHSKSCVDHALGIDRWPRFSSYSLRLYRGVAAGRLDGAEQRQCDDHAAPCDWFMKPEEVAKLQAQGSAQTATAGGSFGIGKGGFDAKAAMFWAFVGLPLAWGVWITLKNAMRIF